MSIHFVSTAVLTSEEGDLTNLKETPIDSYDANKARADSLHRGTAKPLHEQLADRRHAKEEEYHRMGKELRAP